MYLDPSGESAILLAITIGLILFAMFSTSPKMQEGLASLLEMGKDGFFIDFSLALGLYQGGFSFIINFEDEYLEIYPHIGVNVGSVVNLDVGVIDNYEKPGDYREYFISTSVSYVGGVGHSWTPDFDNWDLYDDDKARAYYVTFSPPGIGFNISYYIWDEENQIIIDWGGE